MEKTISYKPNEVYQLLKNLIKSNDKLLSEDKLPVSASIVGPHGIGKSTICKELAQDLNRGFFKLNLAQLTEPAELLGFYQRENKVKKDDKELWITENLVPQFFKDGYEYTGETRTIPCPPDWVVNLPKDSILCLDDYSRSNQLFSQAVMELVNNQEMIGWNLKGKNIQIILNENPDDGNYNTSSMDAAQNDRMLKIEMVWDAQDWASRAEKVGLDSRLINFVLWAPELLEHKKKDGVAASNQVSPRMMDKFFSLVSTIDEFDKNLDLILQYGSISVGDNITSQLVAFINKRLDRLPDISKVLLEYDLPVAKAQLTEACGDFEKDPDNFKAATAAILTTRMYNYVIHNNKNFNKDRIKHYLELVLHPSFTIDQKFMLVRKTMNCGNQFAAILGGDVRCAKYLVS